MKKVTFLRKFYVTMLAALCVVSVAVANTDTKPRTLNAQNLQLRDANTIVKKQARTNVAKSMKSVPVQKNVSKLAGKKVVSMTKRAGESTSIEGTWTFDLGDYYFQTSQGSFTCDFEATLEGNQVWFEDPTGSELSFVAEYSETTGTLTFKREYLGPVYISQTDYYTYQEPYEYVDGTGRVNKESITATYNASAGKISFEAENGLAWKPYTDEGGQNAVNGYFSIYDLEGATKAIPEDDSAWEDYGYVTLEDPWVLPAFGIDQHDKANQWIVPVQRNVNNTNLYRLVDPYHSGPAARYNQSKTVGYITFDATDPDHVVFLSTDAGFANSSLGITKFYCLNSLTMYANYFEMDASIIVSALGDDIPYTTFKDGKLSLGYVEDDEYGIQYDANFGYQGDPTGGYVWSDQDDNPVDMTGSITFLPTEVSVEITDAGYATFSSEYNVDFSDANVTVYTAKINDEKNAVELTEVESKVVPAGGAVILKGEEGPYTGAVVTEAEALSSDNELQVATVDIKGTDGNYYVLNKNSEGIVGFYKLANEGTLEAGKCYLEVDGNNARGFYGFGDDDTTGIKNMKVGTEDNVYYDLQGRRVLYPTKGLYIVNGKKLIVK